MKKKIGLFHAGGGDWDGLYIDGKLIMEGHELAPEEIFRQLANYFSLDFVNVWSCDDELDRYGNHCPETWDEILEKEKQ